MYLFNGYFVVLKGWEEEVLQFCESSSRSKKVGMHPAHYLLSSFSVLSDPAKSWSAQPGSGLQHAERRWCRKNFGEKMNRTC